MLYSITEGARSINQIREKQMTREKKLKQAAEHITKHDFEEDSNDYETVVNNMVMLATSEEARGYWQSDAFSEELEFNIRNILSLHLNNFYQENGLSVPSKIRTNKENKIIELIKFELKQNNYIKNI